MSEAAERTVELAIGVQQIPAPTFAEAERAEFVRRQFVSEGLADVSADAAGNVYARLAAGERHPGARPPPLVICAHLDTVFPAGTDLTITRQPGRVFGPGIGDNALGVAALSGLVWSLQGGSELQRDLWLVADVQEEGLGDLRGMRAVADHFGEAVLGYVVVEGLAFGHVYHRAVGVRRFRVVVRTPGGHAWSDYGRASAVHELAALVADLAGTKLPVHPRSSLNVGTIHGGTGVNVLAAQASCEIDLRSEDDVQLAQLERHMRGLVGKAIRKDVEIEIVPIGVRPAGYLAPAHRFVTLATDTMRELGVEPDLTSGSTDANVPLSRGIPAVVLGITTGGGAHTDQEYIDIEPVASGLEQLARYVRRLAEA